MRGLAVADCWRCLPTVAVASQAVAKVQLPCESRSQDLSPTGTQLAVACKDHSVYLVNVADGTSGCFSPPTRGASGLSSRRMAAGSPLDFPMARWK